MYVSLVVAIVLIGIIVVWFLIPYSPLKRQFLHDVDAVKSAQIAQATELFTLQDIEHLPEIVQTYLSNCGYVGKSKMSYMSITFKDVTFSRSKDQPPMRIDYSQFNGAQNPTRLALIESQLFFVPFEGYDYYLNGKGGMKGMIGKLFTVFHQTGETMDKAALLTFLSESLFMPRKL